MNKQELEQLIRSRRSYLCVGLDTDPARIPDFLAKDSEDPVFEFNKRIVDATIDYCIAYKPNLAFYEFGGSIGWRSLEKTMDYISNHPRGPVFTIADAKRGDIGHSAGYYARAFFDRMGFDAVTVNPYMGRDAVEPFLEFQNKWTIILGLTSNTGAGDFQLLPVLGDEALPLFKEVIQASKSWGTDHNTMFVIGATQTGLLKEIRQMIPDHFFLVPGIGAQGGDLGLVSRQVMNKNVGLIVNASRNILYASSGPDFADAARQAARAYQMQMDDLLSSFGL